MKTWFLIFINLVTLSFVSDSQKLQPAAANDTAEGRLNCGVVETDPQFGNVCEDWEKYLAANVNSDVPKLLGASAGIYNVQVQFVISKDGTIGDVKANTNHGFGMEEEVITVIKRSCWSPAKRNGRLVNAFKRQIIIFTVSEKLNIQS